MARPLTAASLLPHLHAFRRHIERDVKAFPNRPVRLGLCVSGGPDSMALAHLMNGLQENDLGLRITPVALIIDHGARSNSAEEARYVSNQLLKLGIPSHIDQLQWHEKALLDMTNFESEARIRRIQSFTSTAMKLGIRHLFLGHHLDDQIETIIMRLIRDGEPSILGLQGVAESNPIASGNLPLFGAQFGVQPSLMEEVLRCRKSDRSPSKVWKGAASALKPQATVDTLTNSILGLRPGGIILHRPLLSFSKSELVATCEASSIAYVKDKTNDDPGFTLRNAVRKLRAQYNLPKALQEGSILDLQARCRAKLSEFRERILLYLRKVSILHLDLKSGTAVVRLPKDFVQLSEKDKPVAAGVLAQLCELVTPRSGDKFETLADEAAVGSLVHGTAANFWNTSTNASAPCFLCSKVQFEGLKPPSEDTAQFTFWRLSRQSMRQLEIDAARQKFVADPSSYQRRTIHSQWILWDNRYWIQVNASYGNVHLINALRVRPFHGDDWNKLAKILPSKQHVRVLRGIMNNHAPAKIRYTLPVLELDGDIIAFPTLRNDLIQPGTLERWAKRNELPIPRIRWRIAYKVLPETVSLWGREADSDDPLQAQASAGTSDHVEVWRMPLHQHTISG